MHHRVTEYTEKTIQGGEENKKHRKVAEIAEFSFQGEEKEDYQSAGD